MKLGILFAVLFAIVAGACAPATTSSPDVITTKETPTSEASALTSVPSSPKASSTAQAAMSMPQWFKATLTDVRTGKKFSVADFEGKVVLVELMAVWCPLCLDQQRNIGALQQQLNASDLVIVSLDIDASENADLLKRHADRNRFTWSFALAPRDVANEIAALYGTQFLNPPSTPVLVIDRKGVAHPLEFGIKSTASLRQTVEKYLKEGA